MEKEDFIRLIINAIVQVLKKINRKGKVLKEKLQEETTFAFAFALLLWKLITIGVSGFSAIGYAVYTVYTTYNIECQDKETTVYDKSFCREGFIGTLQTLDNIYNAGAGMWKGDVQATLKILGVETDAKAANEVADDDEKAVPHVTTKKSRTDMVRILLENDTHVNAQNKDGDTALHLAARESDTDMAQALLNNGADVNVQNKNEDTALHLAARGRTETVRALLDNGADAVINEPDKGGETALHKAAQGGHTNTVRVLLNNGADVNAQTNNKTTALYEAAAGGHTDTVRVLLNNGADVDTRDNNERTALHWATEGGHIDTIQVIVNHGADVNARNKDGDTALNVAEIMKGDIEIILLLRQYGAR